ncbi:MAG: type II toxin-antitoxin system VapC family toxin [Planctomycetes bacterium]|nr:type II toxin-antitoxin system VapC family toxin [Planctomycetota bacterium]
MPTVLVDANVLLDIATEDPAWFAWSSEAIERAADRGPLAINPIAYAEVSVAYDRIEDLDAHLPADAYQRLPLPWAAAFLAGKCFRDYRRRGGRKRSPLPDCYIGAHAAVAGMSLLTRDARRYRNYFPRLHLISPDRRR